jgi:hypothetical protein
MAGYIVILVGISPARTHPGIENFQDLDGWKLELLAPE